MSDFDDFFREMDSHEFDPKSAEPPIKPEELPDGEYVGRVLSIAPRRIKSLDCWCLDWSVKLDTKLSSGNADPELHGRILGFGNLLLTVQSKTRLAMDMRKLAIEGSTFSEIIKDAMEKLPGNNAVFKKSASMSKAGKTYHNVEILNILEDELF